EDPRSRRLRLVGDDGDLLADDAIEQRGLAGIGPADDRRVARFHRGAVSDAGVGTLVALRKRTLWMRRRSASSTSTWRPSSSNVSPTEGTRPRRASTEPPTVSKPSGSISSPRRSRSSSKLTFALNTY